MIIGFLLALFLFAPLAYLVARGVVAHSQRAGSPLMGVLFLFLGLLVALSLLSFALMAAASMFGFSATLAVSALLGNTTSAHPGVVTMVGGLLVTLYGMVGVLTGPTCAFVAAKISALVGLVLVLAKVESRKLEVWLPVTAAGVTLFTMWPFTAYLTFGL